MEKKVLEVHAFHDCLLLTTASLAHPSRHIQILLKVSHWRQQLAPNMSSPLVI